MSYATMSATALRMITAKGRPLILRRKTEATPVDPTKPWRVGVSEASSDYTVYGVELPVPVDRPEGTKRSREDRVYLLAAEGLGITPEYEDVLVDGTAEYAIQNITVTKPGDTVLVYELLVRQWPPRSNS